MITSMRVLVAAAAVLLLAAISVFVYSLTMDISRTTSDQNLVQFWAGLLLLAAVACGAAYGLVLGHRKDRRGE